jgi:hypothetical protein
VDLHSFEFEYVYFTKIMMQYMVNYFYMHTLCELIYVHYNKRKRNCTCETKDDYTIFIQNVSDSVKGVKQIVLEVRSVSDCSQV